jgi:hypothetical protein
LFLTNTFSFLFLVSDLLQHESVDFHLFVLADAGGAQDRVQFGEEQNAEIDGEQVGGNDGGEEEIKNGRFHAEKVKKRNGLRTHVEQIDRRDREFLYTKKNGRFLGFEQ